MKYILLTLLVLSINANGQNKVIYGNDDRLDLYQVKDAKVVDLARSTAAMIKNYLLEKSDGENIVLVERTLSTIGICQSERFANQMTAARCSGFLVGDDLLMTAGHCMQNIGDCRDNKWVFDYAITSKVKAADTVAMEIPLSNMYGCKEIVSQVLNERTGNDYALVRLDRKVVGRTPLKVRSSGKLRKRTPLFVIGHPSGLPTKVAAGAKVRRLKSSYFTTNLDTFGGNSGSAVFNAKTYEVEGILVRGDTDYVDHRTENCRVVNKCTDRGCRGEDVTRITNITIPLN